MMSRCQPVAVTLAALFLTIGLFACTELQTYSSLEKPINVPLRASAGENIWRVTFKRDLPNAYGKADVFL